MVIENSIACSKRSDSGERCEVKKAMKSRGGLWKEVTSPLPSLLFFRAPFTSHRSPLSERLEQAKDRADYLLKIASDLGKRFSFFFPLFNSGN